MKYQVLFTEQAKRSIASLPGHISQRVIQAIEKLASNPVLGKMLQGELQGLRSYRVGDYRIIYEIQHKKITIIILTIGHRKDVYR